MLILLVHIGQKHLQKPPKSLEYKVVGGLRLYGALKLWEPSIGVIITELRAWGVEALWIDTPSVIIPSSTCLRLSRFEI